MGSIDLVRLAEGNVPVIFGVVICVCCVPGVMNGKLGYVMGFSRIDRLIAWVMR